MIRKKIKFRNATTGRMNRLSGEAAVPRSAAAEGSATAEVRPSSPVSLQIVVPRTPVSSQSRAAPALVVWQHWNALHEGQPPPQQREGDSGDGCSLDELAVGRRHLECDLLVLDMQARYMFQLSGKCAVISRPPRPVKQSTLSLTALLLFPHVQPAKRSRKFINSSRGGQVPLGSTATAAP